MNGMPDGARQGSREPSSTRVDSRFQTLIVQPATLCNLDCTYCYLPSRGRQTLMTVKVAQQLALSIEGSTPRTWVGAS
jgi:sulfatase maturation enzyme AslB (radical SAM superfamily)